jgi:hypothetical protein
MVGSFRMHTVSASFAGHRADGGDDHINQLPAPGDELGQGMSLLAWYPSCLWLHTLWEQGKDPSIQCIGLRELTSSTGKIPNLPWVDEDDRKARCARVVVSWIS